MLLFIISWFLCGLLVCLILTVYDLRGREYNPNYFNSNFWLLFLGITISGYMSAIIMAVIAFKKKILDKFEIGKIIHKIANIGVRKRDIKTDRNDEGDIYEKN